MSTGRFQTIAMLLFATGCGARGGPAETGVRRDDAAGQVAAFRGIEDEVLRGLAALDRRVAARAQIEGSEEDLRRVSMGAVLAEDATLGVVDGVIDPFSFEARARGLAAVKAKLAAAPAGLPPSMALEKELLTRLVDEESMRLEEERALPRSASALMRGVVETWSPPASPQQSAERDRWLARRLGEVRVSVAGRAPGPPLDVVRARELDDTLDALEHAIEAAGLSYATAELVKLREVLEAHASRPAAGATSDWGDVSRGVRAHLGFALAPEVLEARLVVVEKALRTAAEAAIADAHLGGDALGTHAAPLVFGTTPCVVKVADSRVRSMAPPPERLAACRLRQAVAVASNDAERAVAIVAMHDHVVIAQWALDVARGRATIAEATARHRPMSIPGPDVIARWERIALARPTAAIGGGVAAAVLYGKDEPSGVTRARAWSKLGEVPLDIAERELSDPH